MEYKLGDLIKIKHGYAFKGKDFSDIPTNRILLTPGNFLIGGGFNPSKVKYYSTEAVLSEDYILKENDLILTMTDLSKDGDTLGFPALIPNSVGKVYLHNQRLGKVTIIETNLIDKYYLYFLMRTQEYRHHVLSAASGTTVKHTSPSKILNYKVKLPNINLQKKVRNILMDLENKITINLKSIDTLEQIAHTLFKHWFEDFEFPNEDGEPFKSSGGEMMESELGEIPRGWNIETLGSIAEKVGNSINVEKLEKVIPYIGLEHMPRGSIALSSWETSEKINSNKTSFQKGDILFGKLRPYFKKVGFAPLDGICSTDIVVFNSKNLNYYSFLMCVVSRDDFIDYCNATATGTRMPRSGWNQMIKYNIVKPPEEVAKLFNEYIKTFYLRINGLIHENINLKSLRDALLPKLLSGEIEFTDETEVIEHVSIS